ncbi:DUF2183 domain-containing protein [bacterium]|nr:MAG: DUF2183 domain-containing protein [bacterium]
MKIPIRKLICALALLLFAKASFALKPDETALFYPTDAALVNGVWEVPVHGWIFEPEEDSVKRGFLLDLAKKMFDKELRPEEETLFKQRAIRFLADSEEGKKVSLSLCKKESKAAVSSEGGQVNLILTIPEVELCETQKGWTEARTEPDGGDGRVFTAPVQLVEPRGVSVVSDIDDTIKISNVLNREALFENTFLRPFVPVGGMPAAYRKWESEGARFHYLSASPWQLYEPLFAFLEAEGFPRGSLYLKSFRLTPSGIIEITNHSLDYKLSRLTALFERYPERKFILVGDSGEQDPEIYGQIARKVTEKVLAIFIRDVTGDAPGSDRYRKAFSDIPEDKIRIFKDPSELKDFSLAR